MVTRDASGQELTRIETVLSEKGDRLADGAPALELGAPRQPAVPSRKPR